MLIPDYTPVKEAYFGKTKNLMEVERLVAVIIKKFTVPFKDIGKRRIDAVKVNKSKENQKIEALLCKEFGFKEMVLHWDGNAEVNAYTVTHGILKLTDGSEPVLPIKNSDGTYYDSKHAYICVVNFYAGMIDIGLTPEEVTATILHEIGHNFVCTPVVNVVSMVEWAMLPVNIYCAVKELNNIKQSATGAYSVIKNDVLKQHPAIFKMLFTYEFLATLISIFNFKEYYDLIVTGFYKVFINYKAPDYVKEWFSEFDKMLVDNKNKIIAEWDAYVDEVKKSKEFYKKNPDYLAWSNAVVTLLDFTATLLGTNIIIAQKVMSLQSGYSNEVFADSFASAYGYGAATVSLQRKLSYYTLNTTALNKRNSYNVYNQYILIMTRLMVTFLDEHPMNQTRMSKQIEKLRADLNSDDVDPRVRKELLKDLERSEKIYNEYVNKIPPEYKHLTAIVNFIQINERYFGGKLDLREPINRVLNFGKDQA